MKKLLPVLLLFLATSAFAQQDALFSQYMFNKLTVNPGYAGSREVLSADLVDRYQWLGIDGAPKTLTLSVHAPLRNSHVGVGFYIYSDQIGPTLEQGFEATYAYRINLPKGKLSFGLQAGFKYFTFDWNKILVEDPDYMFEGTQQSKFSPDANFGIYYYSNHAFAGISSKQLLQNQYGMVNVNGKSAYSRLMRHFYGMGGLALPISDKLIFRPSTLIKYVANAPLQVDINASFLINEQVWLGMTYRTEHALVFITEFNIGSKLRIGYSYDLYLNELINNNKGSHEIRLGLDIDMLRNRMLTPRYF